MSVVNEDGPDFSRMIRERLDALKDEQHRLSTALGILEAPEARQRPRTEDAPSLPTPTTRRRRARATTKDRVIEALRSSDSPLTASEVAPLAGVTAKTASTLLSLLARDGRIEKANRGYAAKEVTA